LIWLAFRLGCQASLSFVAWAQISLIRSVRVWSGGRVMGNVGEGLAVLRVGLVVFIVSERGCRVCHRCVGNPLFW
jgi:hypothetical protein